MPKILLVEDDKLMIKLYQGKLKDEGFEVVVAENGVDGFKMAGDTKPDLILLDILMPGLRGTSVLQKLKEDQTLNSIPVIILTNLESEEATARLKGASDFLVKAKSDSADVIDAIKRQLSR